MDKFEQLNYNINPQPVPSSFNDGFSQYETLSKYLSLLNETVDSLNLTIDEVNSLKSNKVDVTTYNNYINSVTTILNSKVSNDTFNLLSETVASQGVEIESVNEQLADIVQGGGYVFASFKAVSGNVGGDQVLSITYSSDGLVFEDNLYGAVYKPSNFPTNVVRDPSIIWSESQSCFFITHTDTGATGTTFSIIKSTNLLPGTFSVVAQIDVSSIGSVIQTWAPEFVQDGEDVYIVFSINTSTPYWIKATNPNLTTWTTPVQLVVNNKPTRMIDPVFIKKDSAWYMFAVDTDALNNGTPSIIRGTSNSVVGTYTIDKTGNWAGFGNTYYEGPSIIKLHNGKYRLYLDHASDTTDMNYYFADSDNLETFGAVTPIVTTGNTAMKHRHGTMLPITSDVRNRIGMITPIISSPRFVGAGSDKNQNTPAGVYAVCPVSGSNKYPGILLANDTKMVRIELQMNGDIIFDFPGVANSAFLKLQASDNSLILLKGGMNLFPSTQTTAPSAGGAAALPATPAGYMSIGINGMSRKIPYY